MQTASPAATVAPMSRKEAKLIASIESAVNKYECELLYRLAAAVKEGCIVEIGSFWGRSTAALALGSRAGGQAPVYAIEPHERFTGPLAGEFYPSDRVKFFKNMLQVGVADVVRLVNLSSEVVTKGWTAPVGFLWIDGDHQYAGAKRDYTLWRPHLAAGASIAFHDSLDPKLGPIRVIKEAIESGECTFIETIGVTTVLRVK